MGGSGGMLGAASKMSLTAVHPSAGDRSHGPVKSQQDRDALLKDANAQPLFCRKRCVHCASHASWVDCELDTVLAEVSVLVPRSQYPPSKCGTKRTGAGGGLGGGGALGGSCVSVVGKRLSSHVTAAQ